MAASADPGAADRPFCVTPAGIVTWAGLFADVDRARAAIAPHDAVCNMAASRYEFAVLLAAALIEGRATLLPQSRAERAVEAATRGWSSPLVCEALDSLPPPGPARDGAASLARLGAAAGEVHVFTSGSTGEPVRHRKGWAALAGGALLTAQIVARAGLGPERTAIAGTTPHQHMYGLEATVFTALAHGYCMHDARVFYPADIEAMVGTADRLGVRDLVLVSSPPHLHFLAEAIRATPRIRCVISATAPLHRDLATRLEAGGARSVFEIYGCTEAGSLAWRRTAADELWTLLDGFTLARRGDGWLAHAPHLAAGAMLADDLEVLADGRFRLAGRRGDMVSIAGKRQGLGALNAALATLACIRDGVVLRETVDGEDRLSILVVPDPRATMDAEALRRAVRAHMRAHFDPVFVPRRIGFVDALPRDGTGKIAARDLAALCVPAPPPRRPG
ncbi:MAG TPA: AMP-binding protein [Thermohalobaculum sp.]|nr:AMP-binding protein [Thermohalobaculum sp.]